MPFLETYGPDMLKGALVIAGFLVVMYFSVGREPKTRANGVPYGKVVGQIGPENDWDKPAA